jgi:TM2 domain-containing membrane protein YozV
MEAQKVDMYLMTHNKFFESHQLLPLRETLINMDDSRFMALQSADLKDPTTILIVSIIAGHFGIDRFLIGDTGLGVAKLLTCGGLGIWTLVDWFLIMGRTREKNFAQAQMAIL